MRRARDLADIIGGVALIGGGAWFVLHSTGYNMGTLRRMGPGYFPVIIGSLVCLFGILVMVPAMFRQGTLPVPDWRPFVAICLSVLVFALVVERLGLVPATVCLTFVAALAERVKPLQVVLLAAGLCVIGVVVFSKGLGIPIPAFRWNFF
ncbi:tripartite tricarboxylate transporter TctB family protein [Roseomonas aerophila]|uniref:Tripartite tricarboxylate transporter TctB family protein n=1 Tax=Teichococcus aerophilus TaxID=1224513 RepID=A0ABR7RIH9_9PROT|nr:tripartite tricarboxylate transporter TctB family protein [Pseudoroseomonas aerophila]